MNWYLDALKKYAVFNGRSHRKAYWLFVLFNMLIAIGLAIVDSMAGTFDQETGFGLFGALYALAVFLPGLAITVRRLHDTSRSGWWALLVLIPVLGVLVLIVFMVLDSHPGTNEYGPNPKGVTP
ncbi:MAG: DUF805 domain-containing protein [Gammaproteobacteria bacterium]|jgi:uncharacterized membrane protein YhaH (DUF805 family)